MLFVQRNINAYQIRSWTNTLDSFTAHPVHYKDSVVLQMESKVCRVFRAFLEYCYSLSFYIFKSLLI